MSYRKSILLVPLVVIALVSVSYWRFQKVDIHQDSSNFSDEWGEEVEDEESGDPDTIPQYIEAIPETNEVWYEIPELSVRFRLNRLFAEDLIYEFSYVEADSGDIWMEVAFSLRSLVRLDENCLNSAGRLIKLSSTLKNSEKMMDYLDMDDFVAVGNAHYNFVAPEDDACVGMNKKNLEMYPGAGSKSIAEGVRSLEVVTDD